MFPEWSSVEFFSGNSCFLIIFFLHQTEYFCQKYYFCALKSVHEKTITKYWTFFKTGAIQKVATALNVFHGLYALHLF